MYLIFDTETTGLPLRKNAPIKEVDNWPDWFKSHGKCMILWVT